MRACGDIPRQGVQAGDAVLVVFAEEDFSGWWDTGSVSAPPVLVRHELHAVATRSGEHWQAQVQARELAGRLEYTEGAHGQPGAVRARLSRLNLAAGDAADANALEQPPSRIPCGKRNLARPF